MSRKKSKHRKKVPLTDPNQNRRTDSKNEANVRVRGAIEVHLPHDLTEQHKAEREEDTTAHIAEREENRRRETNKAWREWLMFAAVVIYAGLTLLQVCLTRKLATTAEKQLSASQRPWVGLDDETPLRTTPLAIDGQGTISLNYSINAKNFGNYGAQAVFAFAHLIITQDISDMPDREKRFCGETVSTRIGFALFPGARTRATSMFPDSVRKSDMVVHSGSGKEFQAYLIGCVAYADQFNTRHHTIAEFRLGHAGTIQSITFEPLPNTTVQGDWVEIHSYFLD
jgi:hypothetical protein